MKKITFTRLAGVTITTLWAGVALAHPGHDEANGLLAGLLHPVSGLDHLIALLSVGALFATTSLRTRVSGLAVLLASLFGGAALGVAGLMLPATEWMIALSVLVAGLMLIRSGGTQSVWLLGGTTVFALFHGYAHGLEASGSVWAFVAGFLLMSSILVVVGNLLAQAFLRVRTVRWLAGGAASLAGVAMLLRLAL